MKLWIIFHYRHLGYWNVYLKEICFRHWKIGSMVLHTVPEKKETVDIGSMISSAFLLGGSFQNVAKSGWAQKEPSGLTDFRRQSSAFRVL